MALVLEKRLRPSVWLAPLKQCRQRPGAYGRAMGMADRLGPDEIILGLDIPLRPRYVKGAWSFLEDAEEVAKGDGKQAAKISQWDRYLCCCAAFLRTALQHHYGSEWAKVPDQGLTWFLSAARHLVAHPAAEGGIRSDVTTGKHAWDRKQGRGWLDADIVLSLDLSSSTLKPDQQDAAKAYLQSHGGNLFLALHAAVAQVAQWLDVELDEDFRKLRDAPVGQLSMRVPINDRRTYDALVRTTTRGGHVDLGRSDDLGL
jgi:hypothetical protein